MTTTWRGPAEIPDVPRGKDREFIVCVERAGGARFVFAAHYLNAMPLQFEDECPHKDDDHFENGCPATGWHEDPRDISDETRIYSPILSDEVKLIGWQPMPAPPPKDHNEFCSFRSLDVGECDCGAVQ